ncbi:dicarboxylate/amino acid:cation symporter [Lacticaseibacillus sp. GG6-2]
MRHLSLLSQIMIGIVIGGVVGLLLGERAAGVAVLGTIFLRLVQMAVIVLILGAVIEAIGGLKADQLGRVGVKTIGLFLVTTVLAAVIGLGIGYLVDPGVGLSLSAKSTGIAATHLTVLGMVKNFIPDNIFASLAKGNIIQVIIFALCFGGALNALNREGKYQSVLTGIHQLNAITIRIITMIMRLAPIGIGALIAQVVGVDGLAVILPLVKFLGAFAIASVLFLGLLFVSVSWYVRMPLKQLLRGFERMILLALTTTSSAICLPIEMQDAKEKLGVDEDTADLVLPLGMSLNSNGLAMFLALACLTLAQVYGLSLGLPMMVRVVALAVLACLGTVVVPGGGLVALTIVVPTLGLPLSSIALLAGIEWFSGMFRTVLNVVGDTTTAMVVSASETRRESHAHTQTVVAKAPR